MYRIKDWNEVYESPESRRLKSTRYVCVPNKHDGKGFRRIQLHARSIELFCAWNLIIQVASKCPERGVLVDRDGAITPADLELKTGFPEALFAFAYEFFSSGEKLAWLEKIPGGAGDSRQPPETPSNPQQPPVIAENGDSSQESAKAGDFLGTPSNPQQSPAITSVERREEKEEREESGREDARAWTIGGPKFPPSPPPATQADYDRAKDVLDLYPAKAKKDGRVIAKDMAAQNVLAARIAAHPGYPWEEHAELENQIDTPKNAHAWALTMPDPIALEALRTAKKPAAKKETWL